MWRKKFFLMPVCTEKNFRTEQQKINFMDRSLNWSQKFLKIQSKIQSGSKNFSKSNRTINQDQLRRRKIIFHQSFKSNSFNGSSNTLRTSSMKTRLELAAVVRPKCYLSKTILPFVWGDQSTWILLANLVPNIIFRYLNFEFGTKAPDRDHVPLHSDGPLRGPR